MEKFTTHTGIGVPLRQSNVDTDQIIPAVYLKRITRTGFEDALFSAWRKDPAFILNQAPFNAGSVLVAGPDFGTGSSREHAVWALKDYGFKTVLSSRFADIFRGNSGKQGLLAAELAQDDIELIWKELENAPGPKSPLIWCPKPSAAATSWPRSRSTITPAGGSWRAWMTSASRSSTKRTSRPTKPPVRPSSRPRCRPGFPSIRRATRGHSTPAKSNYRACGGPALLRRDRRAEGTPRRGFSAAVFRFGNATSYA